jgi:hypothetical protein
LVRPNQLLRFSAEEVDDLLDRLEAEVPVSSGLTEIAGSGSATALVFADTHGDYPSTEEVVRRFLGADVNCHLIGLGDYIDRPPEDCPHGSVANALYLLQVAAAFPDRVHLLQGNHESVRRIPALPHDLPEEVDDLWGPEDTRYQRIIALLERGSYAARTTSGAYLCHAGFPSGPPAPFPPEDLRDPPESLVADLLWRDPTASRLDRRVAPAFTERDLKQFLAHIGANVFLRGHDPDLAGRWIFGDRCLTLNTTRVYESYGGVLLAQLPLGRPFRPPREVLVEHLSTEGRGYRVPP